VLGKHTHQATVILGEREMVWAMYGDPWARLAGDAEIGAAVARPIMIVAVILAMPSRS
jgi:hypothetical protein